MLLGLAASMGWANAQGTCLNAERVSSLAGFWVNQCSVGIHVKWRGDTVCKSTSFYIEDIRVPNMVKNHHLARSILEQQWGTFFNMLAYKAESAGGWVREVNPRNTSQRCSDCGALPESRLTLGDRTYVCLECGLVLDRDVNAAQNVLQAGLLGLPGGTTPVCSEEADHDQVGDWPRTQNRMPDVT